MGFVSEDLRFVLDQIRQLRNVCAHHVKFNFYDQSLNARFKNIADKIDGRKSFKLIGQRYFDGEITHEIELLKCLLITVCAILLSIQKSTVKTTGNFSALDISNR